MKNIDEEIQDILETNINLIDICEKNLELQKIQYKRLKKEIVELEGVLIRAGLPIKSIKWKPKKEKYWREW